LIWFGIGAGEVLASHGQQNVMSIVIAMVTWHLACVHFVLCAFLLLIPCCKFFLHHNQKLVDTSHCSVHIAQYVRHKCTESSEVSIYFTVVLCCKLQIWFWLFWPFAISLTGRLRSWTCVEVIMAYCLSVGSKFLYMGKYLVDHLSLHIDSIL
jgi:hypothetical protein